MATNGRGAARATAAGGGTDGGTGGGGGGGLPPRPTLDFGSANLLLSPRTRRRQRGMVTNVLDNVTTASTLTNPPAITPELLSTINSMMPPGTSREFRMNPSPDEIAIKQRGRRQVPLTFSPDVHSGLTPQRVQRQRYQSAVLSKNTGGINRLLLPTRSSPRKRLTLGEDAPSPASALSTPSKANTSVPSSSSEMSSSTPSSVFNTPSPDKGRGKRPSPITKKARVTLSKSLDETQLSPLVAMKALSRSQLLNLIGKLVEDEPSLERRLSDVLPEPDLAPMEEKLAYLKRNIFKTLPNTRLESRTDSMSYNRVYTHLLALKKAVGDQGKQLVDSQQWSCVVEHCIMAWGYVKATPVWDNPPHNNIRRQCFKTLVANCLLALRSHAWKEGALSSIKTR